MLIERFEVYKYENVFYSKEELEQMGFVFMESKEDYICLKDNNENYEITEKSGSCETVHSIQDYLNFDENKIVGKFLFDFGDCGLILDVKKYYGIRYKYEGNAKEAIIQLFGFERDCKDAYSEIDREIRNKFDEFTHHGAIMYNDATTELIKQNQEKATRQYVLGLISKDNK